VFTLHNKRIRVEMAPEVGGRIVSFVDRETGYDFLWRNASVPLRREKPGTEYDPNFFGGIDELLPNDIPETIAGVECPDHGELWTLEFEASQRSDTAITMRGTLPRFQIVIEKLVRLDENACVVQSKLINRSRSAKPFLWKLHAAVRIAPGDSIYCAAERFTAADPDWSRRKGSGPWEGETVPEFDGSTEFLYLHSLKNGLIGWTNGAKSFEVQFDPSVFRYAWYFASYGGFDSHHVAILEPCTTMPISVNEAFGLGQCPVLEPGESLETTYRFVARSGKGERGRGKG